MKKFLPWLIALVVIGTYAPALRNDFVWDDTALVQRDPLLRSPRLIGEGFQHYLFTDATPSDFYRPIQRLTYTLEYCAVGFQPMVYHATNIALHCGAAIALYFLAQEILALTAASESRRRIAAAVLATLWAVHPAHSAAVAYVSGRADPLAAMFGFSALFAMLRAARETKERALYLHVAAGIALLFAALSKESGLLFPLIGGVILALRRDWRGLRYAGVAGAFVLTIYVTLRAQAEHIPAPQLHPPVPLATRPLIAARAVAEYAGILVWPVNLHMERSVVTNSSGFTTASIAHASWKELQTVAGALLTAGGIWLLIRARRRNHAAFIALLAATLSYVAVSGLFGLNASVAEHWLYVPSAFGAIALAALIESRPRHWQRFRLPVSVAAATALCALSFARCFEWKDQRTFLETTIAHGGDSARMLINLALLESGEGHLDRAQSLLQTALRKEPEQPFALINLAVVELKRSAFPEARSILQRAAANPIVEPRAQALLAIVDSHDSGKVDLRRLRLASRTGPLDWEIERRYIRALIDSGSVQQAVAELKSTLQTQWYRAETWVVLSDVLLRTGHTPQAAEAFGFARRYDVHLSGRKS